MPPRAQQQQPQQQQQQRSALDALQRHNVREPVNQIPDDHAVTEGQIAFTERFLEPGEARALFKTLSAYENEISEREVVNGRTVDRRTAHYGYSGASYTYSGTTHKVIPWGSGEPGRALKRLRDRVEKSCGQSMSYALVNYYQSGKVGLGFHGDDEADLDPTAPIVSISLGAQRKMVFKHRYRLRKDISLSLPSGSRVDMKPPLQSRWKHGIPLAMRCTGLRINVTFRSLRRDARGPKHATTTTARVQR